jgi:hypothetical protein
MRNVKPNPKSYLIYLNEWKYFINGMSKGGKGMIEIWVHWVATVSCEGWLANW